MSKLIILVNACTHGYEKVGKKVIDKLKDLKLKKGSVILNLANEKTYKKNKAFIYRFWFK